MSEHGHEDGHRRDQQIRTGFAVLTISDSRTPETDRSGQMAMEMIEAAGHRVIAHDIVPNHGATILTTVKRLVANPEVRVIVTTGGTGVGRRDLTVDTVEVLFDKALPGFGELFRRLSYEEVGLPGVYSRAAAGLAGKTVVYCLPGSTGAVRLALERIILPGIGHLLWEVDRR